MTLAEPLWVVDRVATTFDALGIRYLVGGSMASSVHGVPRTTNDVDVVAEIPTHKITALADALAGDFYVDADMIRDAVARGASFNIVHLATMFKVDVFVASGDPLSTEELSRRQRHALAPDDDASAWFASAEDTVLRKIEWFKKGGGISDRQWGDILGVLRLQRTTIDREYLTRWAGHLKIAQLLERALAEADDDR